MIKKVFALFIMIFSFTQLSFASHFGGVKMEDDAPPKIGSLPPLMNDSHEDDADDEGNNSSQFATHNWAIAACALAQPQKKEDLEPWHSLPMPQVQASAYGSAVAAAQAAPQLKCNKGCNQIFSTQQLLQLHMAAHQMQARALVATAAQSQLNLKAAVETGVRRSQRQKMKKEISDAQDTQSESENSAAENSDESAEESDGNISIYEDEEESAAAPPKPKKNTKPTATILANNARQCPQCKKKFDKPSALKRHFRSHTGERPFECEHKGCSSTFAEKGNLKRHMRTHTGEKPYPCSQCDYKASRKAHLTTHMNSKH